MDFKKTYASKVKSHFLFIFLHREQLILLQQILLQTKKNTNFLQAIYNRQKLDEDTSDVLEEFNLPIKSMEQFDKTEELLQDRTKLKALVSTCALKNQIKVFVQQS